MNTDELPDGDDRTRAVDRDAIERMITEFRAGPGSPGDAWRVGKYLLVEELGRGSMGLVYLARDEALRRDVALKILPFTVSADPDARQRFLLEAQAMARIAHPSVVRIHDVLEDGGTLAIAMERIEGATLADVLTALRAVAEGEPRIEQVAAVLGVDCLAAPSYAAWVAGLGQDLANALQAVHDVGLTHRDVKPSNVLIDRRGRAHLADFGVVRDLEASMTRTSGFVGTAPYAAPEQLRGEPRIDAAADVYGLGATLYEALTLSPPATGSPATILATVERGAIPPLLQRAATAIGPDLALIVHHALEPERDRRYAAARQMAADLQAFEERREISVRPITAIERFALWTRREPARARVAGVAVIAVIALLSVGGYLAAQLPRIESARRLEIARRVDELTATARALALEPAAEAAAPHALLEALELDPDNAIAVGVLALHAARNENSRRARDVLATRPGLVQANAGLRHLQATGVELFQRGPAQDLAMLTARGEPLECFFAALAAVERATAFDDRERQRARIQDAVLLLRRATLMSDPVPRMFRVELAAAAAIAGDETTALDQIDALRSCWDGGEEEQSPSAAYRAASALLRLGRAEDALAISLTPACSRFDRVLATRLTTAALRDVGRVDDAIARLEAAISAGDDHGHLRMELARALSEREPERARELRAEVLETMRAQLAIADAAGRSAGALRREFRRVARSVDPEFDEIGYLEELSARFPDDWELRLDVGTAIALRCAKLGYSLHKGLPTFVLRLRGGSADAAGQLLRRQKMHREMVERAPAALAHLLAAAELAPFHPSIVCNLAQWQLDFGPDGEAAIGHLERLGQIDPDDPEAPLKLGALLFRLHRFEAAAAALARAISLDTNHPASRGLLGWCMVEMGRMDEAEHAFAACMDTLDRAVGKPALFVPTWGRNALLGRALALLAREQPPTAEAIATARAWVDEARERWKEAEGKGAYLFGLDDAVLAECAICSDDFDGARAHLERARRGREFTTILPECDFEFTQLVQRTSAVIERAEARLR